MRKDSTGVVRHGDRKREFTRSAILDAAERLLDRDGQDAFSMRELALEAGMAVTTPFAHFGSKSGVLRALIDRYNARIEALYMARAPKGDAIDRFFLMAEAGVDYLLQDPRLSKFVAGSLLTATETQSHVGLRGDNEVLWRLALQDGAPFPAEQEALWRTLLPQQSVVSFRGGLALWVAEGLTDNQFRAVIANSLVVILLGFAPTEHRKRITDRMLPVE